MEIKNPAYSQAEGRHELLMATGARSERGRSVPVRERRVGALTG
jgi:hypothetical protein